MVEPKSSAELLRKYVELDQEYRELQSRYFPVEAVRAGEPIRGGEQLTLEALDDLDRLGREVEAARLAWTQAMRDRR